MDNKKMNERLSLDIPIIANVDVLVCGGGPAGIAAAIAAARNGSKVMLVESQGCLGGVSTSGLIGVLMGSWSRDGKYPVVGGVFTEIVNRLVEEGAALPARDDAPLGTRYAGYAPWHGRSVPIEFEPAKRVFEEVILEAESKLRYFTTSVATKVQGRQIEGVFVHSKNGMEYIQAQTIVDATGDADIAAQSGCSMLTGLEDEGHKGWMSPASLSYILEDVDYKAFEAYCRTGDYRFRNLISQLKKDGEWPYGNIFIGFEMLTPSRFFIKVEPHLEGFNGLDTDELTMGMVIGRQKVKEQLNILRKHFPGFANARLVQTAPVMGVRATRRIIGQYKVTIADIQQGVSYPDTIALSGYHWDMATPNDQEQRMLHKADYGKEYVEIPYRCMLPQRIDNLVVPGRSVSAEWDALGVLRIMPACFAMGQAAGVAASMAARTKAPFAKLDVQTLQNKLLEQGAILSPEES
jgi:hypothetical protein